MFGTVDVPTPTFPFGAKKMFPAVLVIDKLPVLIVVVLSVPVKRKLPRVLVPVTLSVPASVELPDKLNVPVLTVVAFMLLAFTAEPT